MSRLSREKKREQKHATRSAAPMTTTPIPVHVPVTPADTPERPQAMEGTGAGRWASVGGVRVQSAPGEEIHQAVLDHLQGIALATGRSVLATVTDERIGYVVPLQVHGDGSSTFAAEPVRASAPDEPAQNEPARNEQTRNEPIRDGATHVLRQVPVAPTFALRAVPEPPAGTTAAAPPVASPATPPGTAVAPMGEFGPPPVMDAGPPVRDDPDQKPTPARGFDAVAEAVLGDDPRAARTAAGDGGTGLLAEPMARVSEAVKAGRIEEAATLADRTVAEASGTLGAQHPEVLRLRELGAYIAYLAGDPLRAFRLSLELARVHRGTGDAEGAYDNVRSAATAWRAVRDPEQGLGLGRDLIDLWAALTAEDGPAADDIEQLESARARMGRLTERARRQAPPPSA
ncbi:tetratricopeptide repeat protein [Streptomyces sp. MK5]|uniref:tetratricopeptide repeat protein n=1 Tax=Streptomyces sp. MK5 TaxID=3064253 RepID=UPI00274174AE|nr:tetratricopeptide repeat protein [Streptomyces sp. MK5]